MSRYGKHFVLENMHFYAVGLEMLAAVGKHEILANALTSLLHSSAFPVT